MGHREQWNTSTNALLLFQYHNATLLLLLPSTHLLIHSRYLRRAGGYSLMCGSSVGTR